MTVGAAIYSCIVGLSKRAELLPLVGKELPVEGDHNAVTSRIGNALHIEAEVDGTHDPIAALFVNELLDRRAVDLQHLKEPVDGRINGYGRVEGPPGRL